MLGFTSKGKSSQNLGVEAKQQLTGKFILPKTCVANCSVELDPQQHKTIISSTSTPNLAPPQPLPPTQVPNEGTSLPDPEPPSSIHGPSLSALTPASPARPTPAPLCPAQQAPAPLPPPAPRKNRVTFGPGISEALTYSTTAQAPYPPPVNPPTDDLADMSKAAAREIPNAPYLF